jgi:transcriptional regulator with XRE-family HTH domain
MVKRIRKLAMPDLSQPFTANLLGQAIKARRTQSNLRLEDAAALCGVAKQTLMKIEHGQSTTQIDSIIQICLALGIKLAIIPWLDKDEVNDDWQ